jgi:hypothetical protein
MGVGSENHSMDKSKADSSPVVAIPGELQQMWLQLVRGTWSSIAVIPTEPSTSPSAVTEALVSMAQFYDLGAFEALDAQRASLQDGVRLAHELAALVSKGSRVVVAVDSPMENGGAIPVVTATDAAILLVRLGASDSRSVRCIIDIVGRERVLGAVALKNGVTPRPRRSKER